ncbi:MAG: putative lipid II flippase FtsW [Candidatus Gottesmanbacteria bacterium]
MKFLRFHKSVSGPPDWLLIGVVILLSGFGLLMVYDSSVAIAIRDFGNQYYYLTEQLKWLILGLIVFFVTSVVDYRIYKKLALPMLLGTIFLLLIVFIPGVGIKALGAKRWINLGFTILQPAELAKLSLVIYLSAWFSTKEKERLVSFLILLGMIVGLIILEPDLGTTLVIMATAVTMYFFSGAPVKQFILMLPALIVGVFGLAVASPYRFRRLTTFFNPENDPLGASYHIRQATIALGSGGLFGVGIGGSRQKYEYLPEANTDSIFAIIGEEIGFIGATLLIGAFLFIIWRGFRIARHTEDPFGRLLALGITSWISYQVIMNIAAMVALIPLTGVPMPLLSYGGSSLIVVLAGLGILVNISKSANHG